MCINPSANMSAKKIAEIMAAADNIVISVHTGPDGDAIGSMSALLTALRTLGKNVIGVMEGLPHRYCEIDGVGQIAFEIPENFPIDTFIALDCGDKARLGKFEKYFDKAAVSINIDHHASNNFFGKINYVDANSCATAEMLYNIFIADKRFVIDKGIASALYAGILYDSGGFRHSNVTSETYFIAGELIKLGADFNAIYNKILCSKRLEEIKILSVVFDKMKRELGGRLVWTSVTLEELTEKGARGSDLDSVVDYCKSVEGCEIAAFFYQKAKNEHKISLRSEGSHDVSAIAAKFGGGGHINAAGATFYGNMEQCCEKTIAEIQKVL